MKDTCVQRAARTDASETYAGKSVLVVGLARSGLAAARFLARAGARVTATDLRSADELPTEVRELQALGIRLVLGGHPPGLASRTDLVVTSPGVPPSSVPLDEAVRRGVPVWGELELAYREIRDPEAFVIAITGTKGKSTTSTLVFEILKRAGRKVALGGNIGRPLLDVVAGAATGTTFVVEVSSFQLETVDAFRAQGAVLLNVAPDHLDRYPSYEAYVRAKERLFARQDDRDWAVVYGANPLTVNMASRAKSRKVFFSMDCLPGSTAQLYTDGPWIVKHDDGRTTGLVSIEAIPLRGRHNVENTMAAVAVADLMGVEPEVIREAVAAFSGISHALEKVAELRGVSFYNDSKATNVAAASAALSSFEQGVILILGGRSKGDTFEALRDEVSRKVKQIIALGESRDRVYEVFAGVVPVTRCTSLREAVEVAFAEARPGDTVLLSPACASFDMFRDYADRGEQFRREVERLERGLSEPPAGRPS